VTPQPTPDHKYLDTVLLYFEEEIIGEAYFYAVAKCFDDPEQTHKLDLMARVERHAADAVLPLIQKYGLTPRSDAELRAIGTMEAADAIQDWDALIADMQKSFPDYMPEFRALEAMAPPQDRARLAFLTEHEVAAIKFLDLEAEKRHSVAPMLAYLRAAPQNTASV